MKRWAWVFVAAMVAVFALAMPARAVDGAEKIEGYVTAKRGGEILVEEKPCRAGGRVVKYTRCDPAQWRGAKGYFRVDARTRVVDRTAGSEAGYGDIAVGQRVAATYRGAVAESYPTQGNARRVIIIEDTGAS